MPHWREVADALWLAAVTGPSAVSPSTVEDRPEPAPVGPPEPARPAEAPLAPGAGPAVAGRRDGTVGGLPVHCGGPTGAGSGWPAGTRPAGGGIGVRGGGPAAAVARLAGDRCPHRGPGGPRRGQ